MNNTCAGCGHEFTEKPLIGAFNTFVGETRYQSSVYGSNHDLCKNCHDYEEFLIEQEGTNYLPKLLEIYETDNRLS